MRVQSPDFPKLATAALHNAGLRATLDGLSHHVATARDNAISRLPEFELLRDEGTSIRKHSIRYLGYYLEQFERAATRSGAQVHWARDGGEAARIITSICQRRGARKVVKGKSMVSEEIELNEHLSAHGIQSIETDLGEYIIQLRGEKPSHLIAPALHVTKEQVAETFDRSHQNKEPRGEVKGPELLAEARAALREHFLTADVGITGANFCIAETGSTVLVTNEGNGDLSQNLPKTHIVLTGIEKVVPTLEDACTLLRLLTRSATGQEASVYTTFSTGPRRAEDSDGPEEFHVVLLDNGRSELLDGPFQDILRCIRCGACLNVCPVFQQVGGQAYGSPYNGPMGSVLTPALAGLDKSAHLPNASTFCGRCADVCPVRIPLPDLLRFWREREFDTQTRGSISRWLLGAWAWCARHPRIYRIGANLLIFWLHLCARGRGYLRAAPLPFVGNWTRFRDLPAPARTTFMTSYRRSVRGRQAPGARDEH